MLLDARKVTMAFGAFKAVDDASIAVAEGEILGLIGPNGAGKSTFFNCLTGDLSPTSGSVHFDGGDVASLTPPANRRRRRYRAGQRRRLAARRIRSRLSYRPPPVGGRALYWPSS
jgi:ABC-type branched-subunit amino acid transport system ATPase component